MDEYVVPPHKPWYEQKPEITRELVARAIMEIIVMVFLWYLISAAFGYIRSYFSHPVPSPSTRIQLQPTTSPIAVAAQPDELGIASPQTYGFTKSIALPVVKILALFPEQAVVEDRVDNPVVSVTTSGGVESVSFSLHTYTGQDEIKQWYLKHFGPETTIFERFQTEGHSGYIGYYPGAEGTLLNKFVYMTFVSPDTILLVRSDNNTSTYFFGSDINRFKSFLSTMIIHGQ